tara:strand:+ start:986 stop:1270 length:285 start_codon:yes stop_codon:yes gene_type:complete
MKDKRYAKEDHSLKTIRERFNSEELLFLTLLAESVNDRDSSRVNQKPDEKLKEMLLGFVSRGYFNSYKNAIRIKDNILEKSSDLNATFNSARFN